jgi:hypothetical protein
MSTRKSAKGLGTAADKRCMTGIGGNSYSTSALPAIASGQDALSSSAQQLSQDAQALANPDNQNATAPLTNATQSNLLTQAGAEIISTSNEMLGTLLDVFA